MLKILLTTMIAFIIVIIILLIFITFMNNNIKSTPIIKEKFFSEPIFTNGIKNNVSGSMSAKYIQFNSNGTFTTNANITCDILIVGGGGGGSAGGGGAGGYNYITNKVLIPGTYTIQVGDGGSGARNAHRRGNDGQDSFISLNGIDIGRAYKGGGGANNAAKATAPSGPYGSTGGCGHNSDATSNVFPEGTIIGGNIGGVSTVLSGSGRRTARYSSAGGGGGAGGVGLVGSIGDSGNANNGGLGGAGGIGLQNSITGTLVYYAGGGAGGTNINLSTNSQINRPKGGLGGGGDGNRLHREKGIDGLANTGGGGGGSDFEFGGPCTSGGSGVVIIRYDLGFIDLNQNLNQDLNNLFQNKRPWGIYFAENWSNTTLPDSSGNNRHATTSGTINKTTVSGNGATGAITYISGNTSSTITWPSGSIPSSFTLLTLARYNGGNRRRIFDASSANWLHGFWNGNRGVCHYDGWKTPESSVGTTDDWLCCIGKNSGITPNNILVDGIARGSVSGGTGNLTLTINNGVYKTSESSDWALNCVMIWNQHLTDAEMIILNNFVNKYKSDGLSMFNLINSESRRRDEEEAIQRSSIASISDAVATPRPTLDQQYLSNNREIVHRPINILGNSNINGVIGIIGDIVNDENISLLEKNINNINIKFSSAIDNNSNNPLGLFNMVPNTDSNLASFGLDRYNSDGSFKNNIYGTNNLNFPSQILFGTGEFIKLSFTNIQNFILSKYAFKAKNIDNAPASWKILCFNNEINTYELIETGRATRDNYISNNKKIERFLLNNNKNSNIYIIIFETIIGSNSTGIQPPKALDFGQIYLFKNSVNEKNILSTASNNISESTRI